jgi:putative pyruvate formate lyase activating enzyme
VKVQTRSNFFLSSKDFEPAYMNLYRTGELEQRARGAVESLASCRVCPRDCKVDRLSDKSAVCKTGRHARVSSYFPHHGEENPLRGWLGSGTIFFAWCNLRCQFCQNFDISQLGHGEETPPERLAEMMVKLQAAGCHNINFVTPEHVVPQILEALLLAVEAGLRLPIVYNTSSYDSMESLRQMDGVVDIYMPDFKVWDSRMALKYLTARDYPEVARRAIKEMHCQVGEFKMDENGIARRGVLLRHLVMPGVVAGTREIMEFLAKEVSPHTYVNIMAQYRPSWKVTEDKFPEINRRITSQEYASAVSAAQKAGLYRFAEG